MSDLIIPTEYNEEKSIELHTDKYLSQMPGEYYLRRQKKSESKGFYDFNCPQILNSGIFQSNLDSVIERGE